jgi:hypothetical protein
MKSSNDNHLDLDENPETRSLLEMLLERKIEGKFYKPEEDMEDEADEMPRLLELAIIENYLSNHPFLRDDAVKYRNLQRDCQNSPLEARLALEWVEGKIEYGVPVGVLDLFTREVGRHNVVQLPKTPWKRRK